MIPVIFSKSATVFTTNGYGRLSDCIECKVTEERNGPFELEMIYPMNGANFEYIETDAIIGADPNPTSDRQAFRIYKISKPLDGKVKIYARHISYDMLYIPVEPFQVTGLSGAIAGLTTNALESQPFTITTDITNETTAYNQAIPKSLRECLGGTEGSILDLFSGSGTCEFEWDNYNVNIWEYRGSDNGVSIRYGKNLEELNHDTNGEEVITGVLPFYSNEDNTVVFYGDVQYNSYASSYPIKKTVVVDFSDNFDEDVPTASELNELAYDYVNALSGVPTVNITIEFVNLADTEEYKNVAVLENVNLCDTVHIYYSALGVDTTAKVIKTDYNVLADRYNSIEIGDPKSTFSKTIVGTIDNIESVVTTNQKLVSVTHQLDTEIGEVRTTIATTNTATLEYLESVISQTAEALTISFSTQIGEITTLIYADSEGVHIQKPSDNNSNQLLLTNDGVYIQDADGTDVATMTATSFTTGEWVLQQTNSNTIFNIFRRS